MLSAGGVGVGVGGVVAVAVAVAVAVVVVVVHSILLFCIVIDLLHSNLSYPTPFYSTLIYSILPEPILILFYSFLLYSILF